MLFVKARFKDAEKIRKVLVRHRILANDYQVEKGKGYVYFPVRGKLEEREIRESELEGLSLEYIEREARPKGRRPTSLEDALTGVLSDYEISNLITSFDIIGDIAIIQIPDELEDKAKDIAKAITKVHRNVKVVCRKVGSRSGIFRTLPLKVILGENRFVTSHKEHGVVMKVDVRKAYFSPRLSTERKRIADQVKDGETVAVLFAGVGPFALVIAKRKHVKIYAVELNPFAYNLLVENINLNKLKGEVIPIHGDVAKVYKNLPICDRVLMPAPKDAGDFLREGISILKRGGMLHFYAFSNEQDLYGPPIALLKKVAVGMGRDARIVNKRVVRPYRPRVYQVAIDAILD